MRILYVLSLIPWLALVPACEPRPAEDPAETTQKVMTLTEVHTKHSPRLMKLGGVVGTYESLNDDGDPCIKVMVVAITDALREAIPETLEGYPVILIPTGEIAPRSDS